MRFPEYVGVYALAHGVSVESAEQLRVAAKLLDRFSEPHVETVDADAINTWLASYAETVSSWTAHSRRRSIVTLLRYAIESGVRGPVGKIRSISREELIPKGFLLDDLRSMTAVASRMDGCYRGLPIPKRIWWLSFLNAAYDSGLRLGDLLSIEHAWIPASRQLCLVQRKTGQQHFVEFRPSTMSLIEESMAAWPGRALVWPLWCDQDRWYGHFKRLREAAGLKRGTSKWIRRSSASYVDRDHPGRGSRHLGHRTPELFYRHYRVPEICGQETTLPPAI